MIRQVVFDCGGVFIDVNYDKLLCHLGASEEQAQAFMACNWAPDSPWLRYDQGLLNTAETEEALRTYLPAEFAPLLPGFMREWTRWLPVRPGMETIIDELHEKGLKCYLLSNFAEGYDAFRAATPALHHLDGEVISYREKLIKPDPAAFRVPLERFGLDPAETIYTDDNSTNIDVAREMGYQAQLFTTPAAFRAFLKEKNIF